MSLRRRKKPLTKPLEDFIVFIIDEISSETKIIGRFKNIEEAKEKARNSSTDKQIVYIYGEGNRIVYSTERGDNGKL
tara:strand:- start:410 stop:640 length:231 start_codon:yes stop_codon:yes gene_type:complete